MIRIHELSRSFFDRQRGEIRAVDALSFECGRGEIMGLLGPNGAGKTTTLRMLATLLAPTSGTAELNGYDVVREPDKVRSSLGFLSSTTGLYPRLTPEEILRFFGEINGLKQPELKRRIDELIAEFSITDYARVRCEKLSSGMKQKVSIARALIQDPPVLIFDEPTVGLDVIAAAQTMKTILQYKQRGKCILYSTHIMSEVEKLCDRIAIIHKGKLQAIGTLDELRKQTGERYLEDIFFSLMDPGEINGDAATAEPQP
ncbi:ATP-binding cassette domain-containing protein [bacterium]|nr:ATP-binding cassette domain-containing protein [candidate division CSSED10-310 bacterium]